MPLNWTLEAILSFVAVIPVSIMIIYICFLYYKERKIHFIFYICLATSVMLWALLQGLSLIFLSFTLHKWSYFVCIPFVFMGDLLLDYMTKESVEPIKLAIISAISTFVISSSFIANAVIIKIEQFGEIGLIYTGDFKIAVMFLFGSSAFVWLLFSLKLYHYAPPSMRKAAAMNVFGSFMIGVIAPVTVFTGINSYIPGINKPLFAIGIIILLWAFIKEPRMLYILPFKISVLYVIDNAGIPLFSHSWTEEQTVQKGLFSGMIIGIRSILNETLDKGNVKEIIIDQSTLLIKSVESFRFACVLVASKTSRTLRVALEDFAQQFLLQYRGKLEDSNNSNNFKEAIGLVKECFPFVPY